MTSNPLRHIEPQNEGEAERSLQEKLESVDGVDEADILARKTEIKQLAASFKIARATRGVIVSGVGCSSPGIPNQFRLQERIVTVDNEPIGSVVDFLLLLESKSVGDKITVVVDEWNVDTVKDARAVLSKEYEIALVELDKKNKRLAKKGVAPESPPPKPAALIGPNFVRRVVVVGGSNLTTNPDAEKLRLENPGPSSEKISCLRRMANLSSPGVSRTSPLPVDFRDPRLVAYFSTIEAEKHAEKQARLEERMKKDNEKREIARSSSLENQDGASANKDDDD